MSLAFFSARKNLVRKYFCKYWLRWSLWFLIFHAVFVFQYHNQELILFRKTISNFNWMHKSSRLRYCPVSFLYTFYCHLCKADVLFLFIIIKLSFKNHNRYWNERYGLMVNKVGFDAWIFPFPLSHFFLLVFFF